MAFDLDAMLAHSDTLLRPDVGLLLPFVAACTQNWALLLLSVALQPLKWQSGCGCFVKLCLRKRRSMWVSGAVMAALPALYLSGVVPDKVLFVVAGVAGVGLSYESADTKVLKAVCVAAGGLWGMGVGAAVSLAAVGLYAWVSGWTVRGRESVDVLASNSLWLVTWDLRLAKRVNNYGEWHLEYVDGGRTFLVGDGRLVGRAAEGRSGLRKDGFLKSEGNLRAFDKCVEDGKVVVKGEDVGIAA